MVKPVKITDLKVVATHKGWDVFELPGGGYASRKPSDGQYINMVEESIGGAIMRIDLTEPATDSERSGHAMRAMAHGIIPRSR